MNFSQEEILNWFVEYAYEPLTVYSAIILMMVASGFGLPIPEEITLIGAGFVSFMARHPELYPPPVAGATGVNAYTTAVVAFVAVFGSDLLVYTLGKKFGRRILKSPLVRRFMRPEVETKIMTWTEKYGAWACGIFRFTPGIRFPGHLACGILGIPSWKFILIDGLAAILSVPVQVLLIAFYGKEILVYMKEFKIILFSVLAVGLVIFLIRKHFINRKLKKVAENFTPVQGEIDGTIKFVKSDYTLKSPTNSHSHLEQKKKVK